MNPQEPRTSHGPRYPEQQCTGTAEELFGMSEAEVERMADEISDTGPTVNDNEESPRGWEYL